jgi:C-terminal processing protease CtpA/Prc
MQVEYHRAGIGCMLESDAEGEIVITVVVAGGAAAHAGMKEGDVIESIDGENMLRTGGVERVSSLIRGSSGSFVDLGLRQPSGNRVVLRIQRRAVPGGSAEILGTLFQSSATANKYKEATLDGDVKHQIL